MRISRRTAGALALVLAALLASCNNNSTPVAPPDNTGGGTDLGPFEAFDVFLRPYSVQAPSPSGGLPTPILTEHYLAAFYRGGTELATFDWVVPAAVGTVEPKTPSLSRTDATVTLRLRPDGNLPLGFFEIEAHGHDAGVPSDVKRRFAVVRNTWMKHARSSFDVGHPPSAFTQWPVLLSVPGTPVTADTIFYVENTGPKTIRVRRIAAFRNLNGPEQGILDAHQFPPVLNYNVAPKTDPDISPPALGRRELLFSSQMDPDYLARCPAANCSLVPGYRLWVVDLPNGVVEFPARVLTQDSTFIQFGSPAWYAFNYRSPRWDPTATVSPAARIAFLSDVAGNSRMDLWLADLIDLNADGRSDTLTNYRQLTHVGISAYAWHPDGSRLCIAAGLGLAWVDAGSGAISPIHLPDSTLTRISTPTVYWKPGEHTLIAFQAQSENLSNLYVLDEQDGVLTRLLPFAVPVTTNLYPRWSPNRKELVYVCDYTVAAWANTVEGHPGNDRLNPAQPVIYGMQRTLYPTVWALQVE